MNKITYDLNSYQIKNLNFKQALNKGQVDSITMKLLFELDEDVKFDLSWQVWVTFERPDGSTSTNMLATLDGKYYELTIGSWFTDIAGIGSIQVRIKQAGVEIYAFPNAKVIINDGINAIGTTIDEEEYNNLLRTINNVNNKLESHISKKNNPHNVTAEQLNVYEKEHVDLIDVRVVNVENLASNNSGRLDDVELDIIRIDIKDTQQDAKINEAETELLRLAQDKFDKIPLNNVPFLNALGKVDNRYLDVGEGLDLFIIVPELPPIEDAFENKIYLVPNVSLFDEQEVFNDFSEYFVFNNKWETLGSVGIDLVDYYNKEEIDLINNILRTWVTDNFASKTEFNEHKDDKNNPHEVTAEQVDTYTKLVIDNKDANTLQEAKNYADNKVEKNANITAGTHPKITYDTKGLVTGGEALVAGDIPNLNASKINAGEFDVARIPNLTPTKIAQNASNRFVTDVEKNTWNDKQDKLVAGDNISIVGNTISASGGGGAFHRVRIFSENNKLVTTQTLYDGDKVLPLDKQGYLFEYGTRNEFDYSMDITEDIDLTYSIIPPRYAQATVEDFDGDGDYTGTAEYIILPADKPSGYKIVNINVKGVATNGDYLTDTSEMFSGNDSLYLELNYLDTSNVTNMGDMFSYSQATTLDLSSFDTSNVTDMSRMFAYSQVTILDLSSFDTSNVTDMSRMFQNSKATILDLSSFDTGNVTDMSRMFQNSQMTTLDLSSFDTSNVTNMGDMFAYSQMTTLDLSSFDTSNVTDMDYMFENSQVTTGYARTQTDADKFNSSSNKPSTLTFVVK